MDDATPTSKSTYSGRCVEKCLTAGSSMFEAVRRSEKCIFASMSCFMSKFLKHGQEQELHATTSGQRSKLPSWMNDSKLYAVDVCALTMIIRPLILRHGKSMIYQGAVATLLADNIARPPCAPQTAFSPAFLSPLPLHYATTLRQCRLHFAISRTST